jgi:hypothetical protein
MDVNWAQGVQQVTHFNSTPVDIAMGANQARVVGKIAL